MEQKQWLSYVDVPVWPKSSASKFPLKYVEKLNELVSAETPKEVLVLKKHDQQLPQSTSVNVPVPPKSFVSLDPKTPLTTKAALMNSNPTNEKARNVRKVSDECSITCTGTP